MTAKNAKGWKTSATATGWNSSGPTIPWPGYQFCDTISPALPESALRFREAPLSGIRGFLMHNKVELTPEAAVRAVMRDILGLSEEQVAEFKAETELFGALPELDSMAVAGLLTELEDRLDIMIEDDEVDGELFETFGNLVAFAEMKVTE